MSKVNVRVIGRPYRGTAVGGVVTLSRRDARLLSAVGRVEVLPAVDGVDFVPSRSLETPEAPLETVAHEDAAARKRPRRRAAAKKAAAKKGA